jgi:hypothetical protein
MPSTIKIDAPRLASSVTLPLGDGLVYAYRWRDGTVSIAIAADHTEETPQKLAETLRLLARFADGRPEPGPEAW